MTKTSKGLIRSLVRRGARDSKAPRVERKIDLADPAACDRCGSVYRRKSWHPGRRLSRELLDRVTWVVCPACAQVARGEGYGRVVLRGGWIAEHEGEIRRRIGNVERRALANQPERRLVSMDRTGNRMEVLTTSQKLAHRIARELEKTFGGRVSYSWSDRDGSLYATWTRPA